MTKKILALALAGTTAFSVFGGLNVFAATDPDFAAYNPGKIGFDSNDILTINNTVITNDLAKLKTALENLVVDDNAEEVDDVAIKNDSKTVYLFDYAPDGTDDTDDLKYLKEVLETVAGLDALNTADNKNAYHADNVVKTVTDAVSNYLKVEGSAGSHEFVQQTGETVTGSTLRKNVVKNFQDLLDEVINPADIQLESGASKPAFEYKALYDTIKTNIGKSGIYNAQTSHMMYLRQEYDRISDLLTVADSSSFEEEIARYKDILDARSSDDYKNSSSFNTFLGKYEKLIEDYDSKTSYSKLSEYAGKLYDLIIDNTGTSAGVDKNDLDSLVKTAKEYDAKDYTDNKEAWDSFVVIRDEADRVNKRGKSYSYQSTVDAYVTLLTDAMNTLDPNSSVGDWLVLRLETAVEAAEGLVETDYTSASWKKLVEARDKGRKLLDSSTASRTMMESAADKLDELMNYGKTGAISVKTPSATLRKELKKAIEDAQKMLNGLDKATGAQAVALSRAISNAEKLFEDNKYNTLKKNTLISAVEGAIADIEAAKTTASQTQGWYKNDAGKWMYGEGDSFYTNGWHKLGASWYYFNADGTAKQNEWFKDTDGEWYWFTNNANAAYGWAKVNGEWYYFKGGCKMVTGWVKVNGGWYYMAPSGKMMTGWVKVNNKWYYLSKESNAYGKMLENTTTPDGYKVGPDGAMI